MLSHLAAVAQQKRSAPMVSRCRTKGTISNHPAFQIPTIPEPRHPSKGVHTGTTSNRRATFLAIRYARTKPNKARQASARCLLSVFRQDLASFELVEFVVGAACAKSFCFLAFPAFNICRNTVLSWCGRYSAASCA